MLTFELECEVVGQMAALVVSSEKPEGVGVPDLQRPEVQDTLRVSANVQRLLSCRLTSILK